MRTQYETLSQQIARLLTRRYSTSFSLAARLLPADIRPHIYDIYGLVRIADEIVDDYDGADRLERLDELEADLRRTMASGYSSNPLVQAFQVTAATYAIGPELTAPFFDSMRMDVVPVVFDQPRYERYIYGSAEVVGLMCLRTFVADRDYAELEAGARHLGAAFQKINFLRDLADDNRQLGRYYFPIGNFEDFDDPVKAVIIIDIRHDMHQAAEAIRRLPPTVRPAIRTAYDYFDLLLRRLEATPAADIRQRRVRVPDSRKLRLLVKNYVVR